MTRVWLTAHQNLVTCAGVQCGTARPLARVLCSRLMMSTKVDHLGKASYRERTTSIGQRPQSKGT